MEKISFATNGCQAGWTVKPWCRGGHRTGDFAGIAATGKKVTMETAAAYVATSGKIRQERVYFNLADWMAQLDPE